MKIFRIILIIIQVIGAISAYMEFNKAKTKDTTIFYFFYNNNVRSRYPY